MVSIELSFACLFFGVQLHASPLGPFIFYEVGGAGGIWGGHPQKNGLKGGPSKKNKGKGGSHKILPLLEGSRGKKFSYLGGSCNFLPAPLPSKK